MKDLTNVFAVPACLPKLAHINVSMNRQIIHLDQNFIDALSSRPVEILDFSEIKGLIIDFNDSSQLCEQLKTLILHDSSMTVKTLPDKCKSLESVDLSGNPALSTQLKQSLNIWMFLSIHTYYFAKTMHLNRLFSGSIDDHISNCHLSLGFSSSVVRRLHFSNNHIPSFEMSFDIAKLEHINLGLNDIQNISKDAFIYLPTLLSIELSHNKLKEMQSLKSAFEDLFRKN